MTTLREAAKKALEALEYGHFAVADQAPHAGVMAYLEATDKLRAALAPVPVAWMDREGDLYKMPEIEGWAPPHTMLYATPPQRKPLTDAEIIMLSKSAGVYSNVNDDCDLLFARAIEQAHGIA